MANDKTTDYEQAYAEWCAHNPPSPWVWRDAFGIVRFDPERAYRDFLRLQDKVEVLKNR